jgi:membrane protease subunit HflK
MDVRDILEGRIPQGEFQPNVGKIVTAVVCGLLAIILVAELFTCFYRVDASDEGVVLRFGKHARTSPAGLHMKWPWPVESVYKVPVQRIQTLEFGFKTEAPGRRTQYAPPSAAALDVAEMLTGDLNLAQVEWIVQYRVSDPVKYLFHMGDVEYIARSQLPSGAWTDPNPAVPDTIRDVSESVLRTLVGDTSIDSVLTFGREDIAADARNKIQEMLDSYDAGVEIVTVKLQSTSPPEDVKDAFQEVNRARQNKERVVNEAEGERNRQIPAAEGKRDQAISEAEGYADRIVMESKGEIQAFLAKLAEYEKAPEVTKTRLYLEAMEEVLAGVGEKTIIDESVQGVLPLLNLDRGRSTMSPQGDR